MNTIEIIVEVNGKKFRAVRDGERVTIDQWDDDGCFWEWAGSGKWDGGVTDCAARIGDDVYSAIDDAISEAECVRNP